MDFATILGIVLGMGLILGSIAIGGGGIMPFIDIPSVMITIGGAIAAMFINFPMGTVFSTFGVVKNCFLTKLPKTGDILKLFGELAATARRDGLLALEGQVAEIKEPLLSRGLELVVGGTSKEDIQAMVETEMSCIEERHKMGKKLIDTMAAAAPAFGMIGTLIGLVQMLRTLDDPSKIGGGMAVALLTTLYGAVVANLFCIPLGGKLEARSKEEMRVRELILAGLISLVEGQPPRTVQERLVVYLSPKERAAELKQAA